MSKRKRKKCLLIVANPGLPVMGSVDFVKEGYTVTASCSDCHAALAQYAIPPGTPFFELADPYITCCGKLRRIGP